MFTIAKLPSLYVGFLVKKTLVFLWRPLRRVLQRYHILPLKSMVLTWSIGCIGFQIPCPDLHMGWSAWSVVDPLITARQHTSLKSVRNNHLRADQIHVQGCFVALGELPKQKRGLEFRGYSTCSDRSAYNFLNKLDGVLRKRKTYLTIADEETWI